MDLVSKRQSVVVKKVRLTFESPLRYMCEYGIPTYMWRKMGEVCACRMEWRIWLSKSLNNKKDIGAPNDILYLLSNPCRRRRLLVLMCRSSATPKVTTFGASPSTLYNHPQRHIQTLETPHDPIPHELPRTHLTY